MIFCHLDGFSCCMSAAASVKLLFHLVLTVCCNIDLKIFQVAYGFLWRKTDKPAFKIGTSTYV